MSDLTISLDDYASKNKRKGGGGGQRNQRGTRRPNRGGGGGGPVFERTARNLRQTGRRKAPYNKSSRADGRWTNDKFAELQEEDVSYSVIPQQRQQPVAVVAAAPRTVAGDLRNTIKAQAAKLLVSNVEKQITEEELLQLFAGIGNVKSIALNHDKDGNSRGTALVHYASKANAELAVTEFSGRMLDGEELLIEYVGASAPAAAAPAPSVSIDPLQNIQSAPVVYKSADYGGGYDDEEDADPSSFWGTAAGSNRRGGGNSNYGRRGGGGGGRGRGRRQDRFGGGGSRGGGRGGGGRRNNRENNKNVSADDLDAQMEAYRSKGKKTEE